MLIREQAEAVIPAPPEMVWAVATDYDRFGEWLPAVGSSEVLAREGDIVVAELRAATAPREALALELIHSPPRSVHFHQVDLYRGHGHTGKLKLLADGEGCAVRLVLSQRAGLAWGLLSGLAKRRLRRAAAAGLAALSKRCTRLAAEARVQARAADGEERKKVLEVVRRPDGGVAVWYRGRTLGVAEGALPAGEVSAGGSRAP